MRKLLYVITLINICFQIVYMIIGRSIGIEHTIFRYMFYVFRPEYMLISGIVAILVLSGVLILIVKSIKSISVFDIFALLLNVEYIIYYFKFLTKQ